VTAKSIVEVNNLRVHFKTKNRQGWPFGRRTRVVKAVDGVSFSVYQGETLGLAGETGSGKSTIAKVLVGLYKPTSGTVKLFDEEVDFTRREAVAELRRHVGIVFQDPVGSLNPRLKVREIIEEALVASKTVDKKEFDARIERIVPLVGLRKSSLEVYPKELSGGEKQRVSLARALVIPKKLLVLDEPTSSLDVSVQAQVLNTLKDLKLKLGLSYLFITHDIKVLKYMSNRMGVLFYGKLMEVGRTSDIILAPRHPYTQELVAHTASGEVEGSDGFKEHEPASSGCRYRIVCPYVFEKCGQEPPMFDVGSGHSVSCFLIEQGS
jgi:oligopeptide/dipeptide ABC transporter ATP-binding protein